jgi:hypothetical protein
MKGTIKKIKDKLYVEYNDRLLSFETPEKLTITEGMQVDFDIMKNLNHGWRSGEAENYARIIRIVDNKTNQ